MVASQVVVFHDGDLQRMCMQQGHITTTKYRDLPKLHAVGNNDHQPRTWLDQNSEDSVDKIPLFREVLEAVPDTFPMIVEFKQAMHATPVQHLEATQWPLRYLSI